VLAVLTDGPADLAVAAQAADLAARTGTMLIAAAAVATEDGPEGNPLLPHSRSRRVDAETRAIVARVTPVLHSYGVAYLRTTMPVRHAFRVPPVSAVRHLVDRFGAVAVVTAAPLHDPAGVLRPASEQLLSRPGRPF
jgi:hypothetical protein